MKKLVTLFFFFFFLFEVSAQSLDPVVISYQRNFIRSSITTKIELLNDASRITNINMTPLYEDALNFVLNYYSVLGNDAQLMEVAIIACSKVTFYNDSSIVPVVKKVFASINDSKVRIACLNSFSVLGKTDKEASVWLASWLEEAGQKVLKGENIDQKILIAGADALGKIGFIESFDTLFFLASNALDTSVNLAATNALNQLSEGYSTKILAIFAQKSIKEAYMAFMFSTKKNNLLPQDRGIIAQEAFTLATDISIKTTGIKESERASMIQESMKILTDLSWSNASNSVVKYFYQVQSDYKSGKTELNSILPIVSCLGAMGTSSAAQTLSVYLGVLNSETEQKKTYNEQLMLTLIKALGDLGDKTAFDYLLYIGYLDYPESVKKASREALTRLQW